MFSCAGTANTTSALAFVDPLRAALSHGHDVGFHSHMCSIGTAMGACCCPPPAPRSSPVPSSHCSPWLAATALRARANAHGFAISEGGATLPHWSP